MAKTDLEYSYKLMRGRVAVQLVGLISLLAFASVGSNPIPATT